jgi:hypothetical protein
MTLERQIKKMERDQIIEAKKTNRHFHTGILISNDLKDLEADFRDGAIKTYLNTAYLTGEDFKFIRYSHSDQVVENKKLSGKMNELVKNKITGTETRLKHDAEFSKDSDELFDLRLESKSLTGANEIHISRQLFKKCIEELAAYDRAVIMVKLYPGRMVEGLKTKQRDIANLPSYKFSRKYKAARVSLIKLLVDL